MSEINHRRNARKYSKIRHTAEFYRIIRHSETRYLGWGTESLGPEARRFEGRRIHKRNRARVRLEMREVKEVEETDELP